MTTLSKSLLETREVANDFLSIIPKKENKATVVGLRGGLGSGKTTFVQSVAKKLDITEHITSPTFVILKKYPIEDFKEFKTLVHIDAYRLEDPKELGPLGFENEISDDENLVFIEWPENIREAMPKDTIYIDFEFVDKETRKIEYKK